MIDSANVVTGAVITHLDNPSGFHVRWSDGHCVVLDYGDEFESFLLKIRMKWIIGKSDFTIDIHSAAMDRLEEKDSYTLMCEKLDAADYEAMAETPYADWLSALRHSRRWGLHDHD